jgi:hypothetical protein
MPIQGKSKKEIVKTEMKKFKEHNLHSSSKKGPVISNKKQAVAVGMSEAGLSKNKKNK